MFNHTDMMAHSQLTLVSLDALGGAEALPRVDVAHVGMAVTLAGCKGKKERGRDVSGLLLWWLGDVTESSLQQSSSTTTELKTN